MSEPEKLKKSYMWGVELLEHIEVRCPYCGEYFTEESACYTIGDTLYCHMCDEDGRPFILGKAK